jgi:GTP-binding protein
MFVDRVQVEFQAGRGGNGCSSFRREKWVPHGGPNGGDGGRGGSIILHARAGVNSLADYAGTKFWRAPDGRHGSGADKHGRAGEDLTLFVPPGTVIYDAAQGFVIKDLVQPGEEVVICRGGRGGFGNAHFKSATNRTPREAQEGSPGEKRLVILELRSIAEVGLIGKPNAGKSTLLSRLTRARPEIADYPFTTKFPNLGRVWLSQDRSFVLADIPGLIEGAHAGVGLGHEFLRHVQRAGLLLHLVESLPLDGSDPLTNYRVIREELSEYSEELSRRAEILVVTKAELPDAETVAQHLAAATGKDVYRVSAVTGEGLREMLEEVARRLTASGVSLTGHDPSIENQAADRERLPRVPPHKVPDLLPDSR